MGAAQSARCRACFVGWIFINRMCAYRTQDVVTAGDDYLDRDLSDVCNLLPVTQGSEYLHNLFPCVPQRRAEGAVFGGPITPNLFLVVTTVTTAVVRFLEMEVFHTL